MAQPQQAKQWQELKRTLVAQGGGELDWLNAFQKTADEEITATLKDVRSQLGGAIPFNPLLVEVLLGDVAALLDRAAAYRKEAAQLEVDGVTAAIEHQVAVAHIEQDELLALSALSDEPNALEKDGLDRASAEWRKGAAAAEQGLAELGSGRSKALASEANGKLVRQEAIKKKADASREARRRLLDRYTAPGSAMNYRERYERILELLREDVADAYVRMICVEAGLKRALGFSIGTSGDVNAIPIPTSPKPLEALISWTRSAMREVEKRAESETEVSLVIALRQPQLSDTPLISDAIWNAQTAQAGQGVFDFKLSDKDYLKGLSHPRLLQVGLSFVPEGNVETVAVRSYRVSAKVFLPVQPVTIGGTTYEHRQAPLILGEVPAFGQGEMAGMVGIPVKNASPVGEWRIVVSPRALGLAVTKFMRHSVVNDLRLHLRLLAKTSKLPSDWSADG